MKWIRDMGKEEEEGWFLKSLTFLHFSGHILYIYIFNTRLSLIQTNAWCATSYQAIQKILFISYKYKLLFLKVSDYIWPNA